MKRRGLRKLSKLALGDGALGFWAALPQVYPETPGQRCRVHKTSNVLKNLPKSSQAKTKEGLHQIWMAETREQAESAFDHWLARYQDKYPKAAVCPQKEREALLAIYDFPAKHWVHLCTTNVTESAFVTIRRSSRAKVCVPRQSLLSMTYIMRTSAERSCRRLRGFRHLAQTIEGVKLKDGKRVINENGREAA